MELQTEVFYNKNYSNFLKSKLIDKVLVSKDSKTFALIAKKFVGNAPLWLEKN
jgi:CMP-N-acetylneuraminic acid synthetase